MRLCATFVILACLISLPLPGIAAEAALDPQIQDAHWIWLKGYEQKAGSVYVSKAFELGSEPAAAVLQISADNEYKVWINGSFVGETQRKGDYAWRTADSFGVKDLLTQGRNYIVVQGNNYHGQAAVIATLVIDNGDGKIIRIDTDSSWQAASDPGANWQQGPAAGGDWQPCLDYGRSATTQPWFTPRPPSEIAALIERFRIPLVSNVVTPVSAKIEPQTTAEVTRLRTDGPKAGSMLIRPTAPGQKVVLTCDFGKEMIGFPIIMGKADGRCAISVACGEFENECGAPFQPVIRRQFDDRGIRWSLSDRRAFRFVRFTIEPTRMMEIEAIQAETVGRGVERTGSFACSDNVLNKVYDTSAYTVQLCMQEYFEDGIKRDRLLWVGDLRVEALVAYYCFGDLGLARRSLMQLADLQLPDGLIPGVGPDPNSTYLPDYCAYWVMALADYYHHSGDLVTVKLLYPTLQKLMKWFQGNTDEAGLFIKADRPGWWMFVDWDDSMEKKDRVMAMEALYHWALTDATELARAAGNKKDAADWLARAEKLRAAVNSSMWNDKKHAYADCLTDQGLSEKVHQQPNCLAILAGLPDEAISAKLLATIDTPGALPPVTTPYMNFYVASALFEAGKAQQAIGLIRDYWGEMIARGATTCWEKFDPKWPTPYEQADLSYCHGWSAGPGMMLPAYVAGVRPLDPGFATAIIEPDLGDLQWVKATVPTPLGAIKVDWKTEQGCPTGSVTLPGGCGARLVLPRPPAGSVYTIDRKPAKTYAEGERIAILLKGGRTVRVGLQGQNAPR